MEIRQEQPDCLFDSLKFMCHLLFFGAHPHQTCTVLDMVVVVVFSSACRLLSLFLHSVLDGLLLLAVLLQLFLEGSMFSILPELQQTACARVCALSLRDK